MIFKQIYLTHRWDLKSQSESETNYNKEILYTPQSSRTRALPLDPV